MMDVQIGCPCPPKADGEPRHEHDTVTLPEVLDFRQALTIRQAIRYAVQDSNSTGESISFAEMMAVMAEAYVLHCIGAWSLQDEKSKPIPVTKAAIRALILSNYETAEMVGNAADDLYSEKVVLPLLNRARRSLPATPTPGSTSQEPSGKTNPKLSKRSSITTTPTAATEQTAWSPGGVYSSSPS